MKSWPYWVRWGTVFALVYILGYLLVIFSKSSLSCDYFPKPTDPLCISILYIDLLLYIPGRYIFSNFDFYDLRNYYLSSLFLYSIVGIIVGWVYGKIKNRNRV